MTTAPGITSSVTTLIENIATLTNYVKDVTNAPEEITQCLKELQHLRIYLFAVKELIPLSTENDPWLKTLEQLLTPLSDDPDDALDAAPESDGLFKELEELLDGLDKALKNDPPQWEMVKKRLLWTPTEKSVAEDLKKIERFKTLAMSAVQLDAIKLSHAIKDMLSNVKRTGEDTLCIIEKKQMNERTADVLKWLASDTLDYNDVQFKTLKNHVNNTGQWSGFLKSPEFLSWVNGSGKSQTTLWCRGRPDVGKTFLASIIVDYLRSLPVVGQEKTLVLSIFGNHNSAVEQTVHHVLRSLLKQLVQGYGLFPSITELYDRQKSTTLLLDDFTKCLSEVLQGAFSHVYIILDALDELTDDDRELLVNMIRKSLGSNPSFRLHLLVTSRHDIALDSLFMEDTTLDIEASADDIRLYIADGLFQGRRLVAHIRGDNGPILREEIAVNHKDRSGRTPLMMAASSGDISRVEVLLKYPGIDIPARDNDSKYAYSYAYWQGLQQPDSSNNDRMMVLLEQYGGRPQIIDYYEPVYPTDDDLSDERISSNSGFRIPLHSSSATFPTQDLTGPPPCHDTNGAPIYIGSAIFRESVHPCKIGPHLPVPCSVPFGCREKAHTSRYDLLPFNPDTMEFVRTSHGRLPAGKRLVKGGYEEDGTPLYHGMAIHEGIKVPGKISHRLAGCNITWGNVECVYSYYEILCWK